jgi:hypothetical protein
MVCVFRRLVCDKKITLLAGAIARRIGGMKQEKRFGMKHQQRYTIYDMLFHICDNGRIAG